MYSSAVSSGRLAIALALALVAIPISASPQGPAPARAFVDVRASVETAPVDSKGDAADDPAIWVHPTDPSKSLILATDKQKGLAIYDLGGALVQFLPAGRLNNVDLRDGFRLGGKAVTLVTAGNRAGNTIAIFALDPATLRVTEVAAREIKTVSAYGSCMYRSAKTGKFFYVLANKQGEVQQWELFDDGRGRVDARLAREVAMGGQCEGCLADDELGVLYVGEELRGVWRMPAEPDDTTAKALMDESSSGRLVPDVEGIALVRKGPRDGFIIVSSQGNNSFAVYRRGDNAYVRSFRVTDGPEIDGVSDTDGIDATSAPLGPKFPRGLFVAQDGANVGGRQNFKLVPLERVVDLD